MASNIVPFPAPANNAGFRIDPSLKCGQIDGRNVYWIWHARLVRDHRRAQGRV